MYYDYILYTNKHTGTAVRFYIFLDINIIHLKNFKSLLLLKPND